MQSHTLKPAHARITSARVGRGGKRGKTSGHGGKGQTARAGHKLRPEMRDRIKKLPKRRGYGRNRSRTIRTNRLVIVPVNLAALEAAFVTGDVVNRRSLAQKGIIKHASDRVKILGVGEVGKALSVSGCTVSASARAAIEKAGGSVTSHA
jgi:large subunit ribosomal protein L15